MKAMEYGADALCVCCGRYKEDCRVKRRKENEKSERSQVGKEVCSFVGERRKVRMEDNTSLVRRIMMMVDDDGG
jgi:hypothetical protein